MGLTLSQRLLVSQAHILLFDSRSILARIARSTSSQSLPLCLPPFVFWEWLYLNRCFLGECHGEGEPNADTWGSEAAHHFLGQLLSSSHWTSLTFPKLPFRRVVIPHLGSMSLQVFPVVTTDFFSCFPVAHNIFKILSPGRIRTDWTHPLPNHLENVIQMSSPSGKKSD